MKTRDPNRPVGPAVPDFVPPPAPGPAQIAGRYMRLERLDADRHGPDVQDAARGHDQIWEYMGAGPFADASAFHDWLARMAASQDPYFYAIRDLSDDRVTGLCAYLRIEPAHGVIEIGHILMTPPLQRSRAATEAISAMIAWPFDQGYRRVEWKCDALNAPSMAAARRYGFTHEGVFRQHMIYKGRNRDTAWWAITDGDWPVLAAAHRRWLAPENFDANGRQITSLAGLTAGPH